MKKLFIVIRQGKLDEVKRIIERKPELVNCVSGALPKKDHGQSPLQVALKAGKFEIADYLIEHGADYVAWADRGHYAKPCPGPSNRSMYIDDFIPQGGADVDKNKELRAFMQEYFRSRNLHILLILPVWHDYIKSKDKNATYVVIYTRAGR